MARLSHLLPLIAAAQAHFSIEYPAPIDSAGSNQNVGPCAGVSLDFSADAVTDFHVGGDAIAVKNGHAQVTWLFRATLDQTASGNWTEIYPIVQQSGLNMYCQPSITIPDGFVGEKGVISVVSNAPDGFLYQCATVNFVEGIGESREACTNTSTVEIFFAADDDLSALLSEAGETEGGETEGGETEGGETEGGETIPTEEDQGGNGAGSLGPAVGGLISALLMGAAFLA